MNNIIGLVNYGEAGNLYSIKKAVEKVGGKIQIATTEKELRNVDKIILPGVGGFKETINELHRREIIEPLKEILQVKISLGICLGMQILSTIGFEYGETEGLGLIKAEARPMGVDAKVPHVGFNNIDVIRKNDLLRGIEKEEFYFMHSYEIVNFHDVISTTEYFSHLFVSAVQKDNLFGVQFHPEKSRDAGLELFKNFINIGV